MTSEVTLLSKGKRPTYFKYEQLKSLEAVLRGRTADVIVTFGPVSEELTHTFRAILAINDGEIVSRR